MARRGLSNEQLDIIQASIGKGDSTYKAAEKAGCSESAARNAVKKHGFVKNALKTLAEKEVDTLLIQDEIKTQKNALSNAEAHIYEALVLEEVQARNLTFNIAQKIQLGINKTLDDGTKDIKVGLGDGIQGIQPARLDPKDYLDAAKANDQAAQTQGLVERPGQKTQVNVNQTTAIQTITRTIIDPIDES